MKNKGKIIISIMCCIVMMVAFIVNVRNRMSGQIPTSAEVSRGQANVNGITHANTAKMISLLQYDQSELAGIEAQVSYEDVDKNQWYSRYVNGLDSMNLCREVVTKENRFMPDKQLTYGECQTLFTKLIAEDRIDEVKKRYSYVWNERRTKEIPMSRWVEVFNYLVENSSIVQNKDLARLERKSLYVVGTKNTIQTIEENKVITDQGTFTCEGFAMDSYVDTKVQAIVMGDQLMMVEDSIKEESALNNVWIIGKEGLELKVFINGVQRSFTMNTEIPDDVSQKVADLIVKDKKIVTINLKPEVIRGKVLVANKDYIELEGYGKLPLSEEFRVYKLYDQIQMEVSNGILVGYDNTEFVVSDGKIDAALIKEQLQAKSIRVLLKTTNYKSQYHKEVVITSEQPFVMTYGKQTKEVQAGEKIEISKNSEYLKEGRLKVKSKEQEGKIIVSSIERNGTAPSYRGSIEVAKEKEGLIVINELQLEEYLYAVIPSEMPTSYGEEALKVQAICARSYAYNHIMANGCSKFGAHVDDSTTYQVYNGHPENEESIQAVKATYGQVLQHDGNVIFAYYFSTSCGYTADVENVWLSKDTLPYVGARFQEIPAGNEVEASTLTIKDFSKEAAFREFLTTSKVETYDKEFPWYRWSIEISNKDLKKMVDKNLGKIYKLKPSYVVTLGKDGEYYSKPIQTVGTVKEVKVATREKSGLVTELMVKGTKATVKVKSESLIRQILAPSYDTVIRQDKSEINNLSLLPSSFFVLDDIKKEGTVVGVRVTGGGYGHGVGMSQNGVKKMVELGRTYDQILAHYYNNITIASIY